MFLRKFSEWDTKYLINNLSEDYNLIIPEDYSNDNLVRLATQADVFLGNTIFKEVIDAAVNLKVIQSQGTGVENLDLELLQNTRIKVCNSHVNSWYVAEFAVGLLFSLLKKIHIHDRFVREGKWFRLKNDESDHFYLSDSIRKRMIGFIGFGNIAQHITRFLSGFGVDFIAYRKRTNIPQEFDFNGLNIDFCDFQSVLSRSDILFITVPLTKLTKNMISVNEFKLMKQTAYLINVARGPIINEKSLYKALDMKKISGAAIDVWYGKEYEKGGKKYPSKEFPFHKLDNILLSPYRAGYIKGSSPHLIGAIENLIHYARTKELKNIVDINDGY